MIHNHSRIQDIWQFRTLGDLVTCGASGAKKRVRIMAPLSTAEKAAVDGFMKGKRGQRALIE